MKIAIATWVLFLIIVLFAYLLNWLFEYNPDRLLIGGFGILATEAWVRSRLNEEK